MSSDSVVDRIADVKWPLTRPQQRLVKTGGRLIKHAPYNWPLLAERHPTRRLFWAMVRRTEALPVPTEQVRLGRRVGLAK